MSAEPGRRVRLTKALIDRLRPGQTLWDSEVRGFGVRCQRRAKNYVLKTRVNGRQRWFTIGEHGSPWTPDAARKQAMNVLADIHKGADLAALRVGNRGRPTMADLSERYLQEHADQHKKASSASEDRRNIDNHVLPLLGSKLVSEITRSDIDNFKRAVRDGKSAAKDGKGPRSGYRGGAAISGDRASPTAASPCFPRCSISPNVGGYGPMGPTRYAMSRNIGRTRLIAI